MYCKNKVFKNSIIYKLFLFVMKVYNKSNTFKVLAILETWSKNSFIYKTFNDYAMKDSKVKYSYLYKFLSFILRKLDKIVDNIHNFIKKLIINSFLYKIIINYKEEKKENSFILIAITIISFIIGYLITSLILETLTTYKVLFALVIIFFGVISLKGKYLFELSRKSVVYRIYKYIID